MFRYVLTCTVAFMFVCSWNTIFPISFQPISPLSGNFLQDVADFDIIIEPDSSHESDFNVIKTRESVSEENEEDDTFDGPPGERSPRCLDVNGKAPYKGQCSVNEIKNELGDMGTVFVNQLLDDEDEEKRYERDFKEVEEDSFLRPNDEEEESKGKKEQAQDKQFEDEQNKVANVTNTTKVMFEAIENPPLKLDQPENQCCEDEAEEKKSLVKNGKKKTQKSFGKNDQLKMHFYKYLPDSGNEDDSHENKKSFVINLYPDKVKNEMNLQTPEKYDYIALLSKGKKFVPTVKFTVLPGEETDRRRRSDIFSPFCTSTYRPKPHPVIYKPNKHLFSVGHKENSNYPPWTHVPILFINTVPDLKQRSNKLYRRATDPELDNQYLREANLLIQNVNASLRTGLINNKNPVPAEAGILVNTKYADPKWANFKFDDKRPIKKEVKEGSTLFAQSLNDNFEDLLSDDFSLPSPKEGPLSGIDKLLAKNEIHSLDVSLRKDHLLKNKINSLGISQNKPNVLNKNSFGISSPKETNSVKNEISPFGSKNNNLFKNEVNPLAKDDSLMKNEISGMDFSLIEPKTLTKNEINPLEICGDDNLAENKINPMELASDDDGLIKNEIDPMEIDSSINSVIKNEIDPLEIAPSIGSGLTRYEIEHMEMLPYKDNSLIKNEVDPMEIVPDATSGVHETKRAFKMRQNG